MSRQILLTHDTAVISHWSISTPACCLLPDLHAASHGSVLDCVTRVQVRWWCTSATNGFGCGVPVSAFSTNRAQASRCLALHRAVPHPGVHPTAPTEGRQPNLLDTSALPCSLPPTPLPSHHPKRPTRHSRTHGMSNRPSWHTALRCSISHHVASHSPQSTRPHRGRHNTHPASRSQSSFGSAAASLRRWPTALPCPPARHVARRQRPPAPTERPARRGRPQGRKPCGSKTRAARVR